MKLVPQAKLVFDFHMKNLVPMSKYYHFQHFEELWQSFDEL